MVCIYCSQPTKVINTRHLKKANHIWRRRKCTECAAVFTTQEYPELFSSIVVRANNSQLSGFSRDRLLVSVFKSCGHRAHALQDATALTQTIITKLLEMTPQGLLTSQDIAGVTHETLRNFDLNAAIFYKAYHDYLL